MQLRVPRLRPKKPQRGGSAAHCSALRTYSRLPHACRAAWPSTQCIWFQAACSLLLCTAGVAPGRPMCLATVTFAHFFFGLLLPTFLGVVYWHPPEDAGQAAASRPGAAAGAAAGAAGAAAGASGAAAAADTAAGTAGSAAGQPPSPRKWARCCGWLARGVRRASAALDCQLYSLLGPKAQPAVRAVACWYVLAQCWLLCRLSAGL